MKRLLHTALLCSSLACGFGCTPLSHETMSPHEVPVVIEENGTTGEKVDSSCSYFYFLWGTHAENNKRFNEAEEAFEKALICDPDSRYILRRLPILLIRMGKPYAAAQLLRRSIEKFPDELQDRLLLARLDIRNREFAEAIKLYNEIIELSPDDEAVLLRLGILYSEQDRFMEAEATLRRALDHNPESFFASLYLARLAIQTADYSQAETWYSQALRLNWSVDLAHEIADFYGARKKYKKTEEQYRAILRQLPEDEKAGLGLVHTLLLQKKETAALLELQNLRENSQDPNQIDILTARLYLRSGKIDKAAKILEPVALQEHEPEAAYMLAVIRYQGKRTAEAMTLLRTIEQGARQYEDSLYLQVRILMEEEEVQQAMDLLEGVLNDQKRAGPGLYILLASLFMEHEQLPKAYSLLDTALEEYPDNPALYFEYGLLQDQDGRQEQAIRSMEKVLELEADHAEALNFIGYTWADNNINLDRALEYIQRAMALKPGSGYIQDSLAWVLFRMGDRAGARREIMKALELEPGDPYIHVHLGDIYREQGDTPEAMEAYRKAEELFTNPKEKARVREKLKALQNNE